ncbi:MAG: hypothetical protein GXP38_00075, partial [Chloroflexi bacterium]|nr:hypothetical protein [Chloroflexota bacterium]
LRLPWRWRDGLMMGLFLLLQTWAELTFGTFGVMLIALTSLSVIALVVLQRLLPFHPFPYDLFPRAKALFANAAIAAVLFVLGLIPYLANMLPDMAVNGDFLVEGGGFSDIFSADLLGFFFPTQLHPLLGDIILRLSDNSALRPDRSQFMVNKGQHIFFGYTVMALALFGLWKQRKQLWAWGIALLTFFFILLSWGPSLRLNGYDTGIPGLFPLLQKIPFLQANRYPSRYSILILLGMGLLAALGFVNLRQKLPARRKNWITAAIIALLLFEHLSIPLPLSDFRLPPAYKAVVADTRPGAILDLPIGWRNGFNVFGKSDTIIMYTQWYQTFHHKPRLGGNTSRNPEQKFQYFMENPVVGVLAALENGREVSAEDFQRAQALAPDLLRTYNIHTVLLHTDKVPPGFAEQLEQLFPLDKVEESDGIFRYEALWPPERAQVTLMADSPELRTYLDQGWGTVSDGGSQSVIWATRLQPEMILPAFSQAADLTLKIISPGQQLVDFVLDGNLLVSQVLHPQLNTISLYLPPSTDGAPRHLYLRAEHSFAPEQIRFASRRIGSTGVDSLLLCARPVKKQATLPISTSTARISAPISVVTI